LLPELHIDTQGSCERGPDGGAGLLPVEWVMKLLSKKKNDGGVILDRRWFAKNENRFVVPLQ
jgi:hypothetical protein